MGLVLDKCCCSNDGKLKEFEDFNSPDLRNPLAPIPYNVRNHLVTPQNSTKSDLNSKASHGYGTEQSGSKINIKGGIESDLYSYKN